uniref:Uncharacterized protein n=1 Tax=Glossina palpalis gambiensis TaxID=67801 RepID=A0A1B0AYH6_9MUSC
MKSCNAAIIGTNYKELTTIEELFQFTIQALCALQSHAFRVDEKNLDMCSLVLVQKLGVHDNRNYLEFSFWFQ